MSKTAKKKDIGELALRVMEHLRQKCCKDPCYKECMFTPICSDKKKEVKDDKICKN